MRRRLSEVLEQGQPADVPTAALISLLLSASALPKVMRPADGVRNGVGNGMAKKALLRRAKEVADGDWASAAARKAVQDIMGAMVATSAAVAAGAAVAGSS